MRSLYPARIFLLALMLCGAALLVAPALAAEPGSATAKREASTVGRTPQFLTAAELQKLEMLRLPVHMEAAGLPPAPAAPAEKPIAPGLASTTLPSPPPPSALLLRLQAAKLEAWRQGRLSMPRPATMQPKPVPLPSPAAPNVPGSTAVPTAPRKGVPQ